MNRALSVPHGSQAPPKSRQLGALWWFFITIICSLLLGCEKIDDRKQAYYEKALAFYEANNLDKASVEVRNALQIDGDFAEGRYLHALIHEKNQNWQQMFANLSLVVQLDPNHVRARLKLGQLQVLTGAYEDALANADEVLTREPNNADAQTLRASVRLRQGDSARAIEAANLALQVQPGHVGAIGVLTQVYKQQDPERALKIIGDGLKDVKSSDALALLRIDVLVSHQRYDEALQGYRELIAAQPQNLFYHYRLISLLQDQNRIDEAEAQLRDLVKARPENSELKLWLVDFLARQRDTGQAEVALKQFLEAQPDFSELRMALGKIQLTQGKFGEAEQSFQQLAFVSPPTAKSLEARNALVVLYLIQNQEAKAHAELARIFTEEPQNSEALLTRARIAMAQGRTQDAIADLRTVTRNQGDAVEARQLLARAHEMEGDRELALDNYRQILAVQPTHVPALIKASRLELSFGRPEVAEPLLKSVLQLEGGHPEATAMLIELYGTQRRWDEAYSYAESLIQRPELAAHGHYLKGRLLLLAGNLAAAERAFHTSLEQQPDAIQPLTFLAMTLEQQGRVDDARSLLEEHVKAYPEHMHAIDLLGGLLLRTQPAEALTFYQSQLKKIEGALQLSHLPLLMGLAQAWQINQQPNEALGMFRQAQQLAPNHVGVAVMLAGQYQAMGQYAEAVRYYEQALRNDPDQLVAANNLANLYLEELNSPENVGKAQALAKVLNGTRHPVFLDTLGLIHFHTGNLALAISFFESALATGQAPIETHYHLARAFAKSGQNEQAKLQLRVLLDRQPPLIWAEKAQELQLALRDR